MVLYAVILFKQLGLPSVYGLLGTAGRVSLQGVDCRIYAVVSSQKEETESRVRRTGWEQCSDLWSSRFAVNVQIVGTVLLICGTVLQYFQLANKCISCQYRRCIVCFFAPVFEMLRFNKLPRQGNGRPVELVILVGKASSSPVLIVLMKSMRIPRVSFPLLRPIL